MKVRPFIPADAPAWVDLGHALTDRQTTDEFVRAENERRAAGQIDCRWVAEFRGQLIGTGHLTFFPFDPPGFLSAGVMVAPGYRNRGVGRALWKTVQDEAGRLGVSDLAASVSDTDADSLAWAGRWGFTQHLHRFASELNLMGFDGSLFQADLERAAAQGVTFTDMADADGATLDRYLNFVADRLTETPDLAGHPRWPLAQVREILRLDTYPRPDWLVLARGPGGEWLGITAMVSIFGGAMAYNELTAMHPSARGRGLALPLKLEAVRRARAAGMGRMRTNNHSQNAPMLAVNRRLGFVSLAGQVELHWTGAEKN
ncbi:GNAT family N-acetyltransferase [Deinococcus arenicola]|uniref:GNAT family N-acetyltransferase n=1 Tax=Deinococcus arenicola TaxID=2994950 RepID=A0ABU4DKY2_9DEIO|nr:GNAT family N-acetyltransferase [Deinococcus sp. ZS9-10]MDV6373082.1 GNAT family N-acetyltransferase [Deinococcus sp. ZS9-10]